MARRTATEEGNLRRTGLYIAAGVIAVLGGLLTLFLACGSRHMPAVGQQASPCVVRDGLVVSIHGTMVNYPDSEKLTWTAVKDPSSVDPRLVALGHAQVSPAIAASHALRVDRYAAIGEYVLFCGHFDPAFPDGSFNWVVGRKDMKYVGHFLDKDSR
jgi:hypothetical protein